jgi:hypothetical protein
VKKEARASFFYARKSPSLKAAKGFAGAGELCAHMAYYRMRAFSHFTASAPSPEKRQDH